MNTLYVVSLANNKTIIHLSSLKPDKDILLETRLLYEFARTNPPLKIVDHTEIYDILEIDSYVKKYMYVYGIDNIRGGSYVDEILPEHMLETLNTEFAINRNTYFENSFKIDYLKYKYQYWNDRVSVEFEKDTYTRQLSMYRENMNRMKLAYYYYTTITNTEIEEIHEQLLADIDWLRDWVVTLHKNNSGIRTHTVDTYTRYEKILMRLSTISFIYMNTLENELLENNTYEYLHPETVLDFLFSPNSENKSILDNEDEDEDSMDEYELINILLYLKTFECIIYTCKNRIDEYIFDMDYYSNMYEKNLILEIDYLEYILEQ
jgi:hypothetical protein